jgi:hypothetical protein
MSVGVILDRRCDRAIAADGREYTHPVRRQKMVDTLFQLNPFELPGRPGGLGKPWGGSH